jgi:predicted acylesterase/phospholipase RssA
VFTGKKFLGVKFKRNSVPDSLIDAVHIPGIPMARHWGDIPPPWINEFFDLPNDKLKEIFPDIYGVEKHNYLAISGGGPDGAFGAGMLVGASDKGIRPKFDLVTGISTGALTAPFAFLGPDPKYDRQLKEVYTEVTTQDIFRKNNIFKIIMGDSIVNTNPLMGLISKYCNEKMVNDIAREHKRGRRLYIGTTNADTGRPVIWVISNIAVSDHPKKIELIRKVILASASIPGLFPPVYIDVEYKGTKYDEMHVDGSTVSNVFLYPTGMNWKQVLEALRVKKMPSAYILRNAPLNPEHKSITPRLLPIMGRAIALLIHAQGYGDLYRIYAASKRDGIDFNLAYIPEEFKMKPKEVFDQEYMRALFDLGYQRIMKGNIPWLKTPPSFAGME